MSRIAVFSRGASLPTVLSSVLGRDHEIVCSHVPSTLAEIVSSGRVDVLLLDFDPEVFTTREYAEICGTSISAGVSVVLLGDDRTRAAAIELLEAGAHSFCRKPPAVRELKTALHRACEVTSMKRRLRPRDTRYAARQHVETCPGLVGSSPAMQNVYTMIRRVADLNASVLITGDSGTGKELIARAIHTRGSRKNLPFVAVSCGAIPETLIESELFGHEKGSFTGSTGTHLGYFEQAGAGTLFLDEIGELSPQTQVKLLRVLQQKEFNRLGSSRTIPLKSRIIFATHRNLPRMVTQGLFRQDLFYRVNVMMLHAPSLAERRDDIAELSDHFLRMYSDLYMKEVEGISHAALEILEQHDWPGNVRELENAIQSALIRTESSEIQPCDLPNDIGTPEEQADECEVLQAGTFERMLCDYKIKVAVRALEEHRGNKTLAARSLDISRAYLYRLLNQQETTRNTA